MLKEMIVEPIKIILSQAGIFISSLALVVLILVVGWIIAKLVKTLVLRILDILQLDSMTERIGLDKILAKGGIKYSISELIAVLCYWLIMLISLIIAISMVNVKTEMLDSIVLYIPRVISAIAVLLLGMFFSSFVHTAIVTAVANAGVEQANLFGKIAQVVIIVFAVAISLEQLGIGTQIINLTITILLASLGLAIALAFGLGCKEIASKSLQTLLDKVKGKK